MRKGRKYVRKGGSRDGKKGESRKERQKDEKRRVEFTLPHHTQVCITSMYDKTYSGGNWKHPPFEGFELGHIHTLFPSWPKREYAENRHESGAAAESGDKPGPKWNALLQYTPHGESYHHCQEINQLLHSNIFHCCQKNSSVDQEKKERERESARAYLLNPNAISAISLRLSR